jgi:hypothetical protein
VLTRDRQASGGRFGGLVLVLAALGIAALFVLAGNLFGFLSFDTEEIDRSQPPLLTQLSELAEYRAATGSFQVMIDLERDVRYLPDFVAGERDVMIAYGTVDAMVDFSDLDERRVQVSEDRRSVTVRLPPPAVTEPRIDNGRTRVVNRDRGVLNRLGGIFSDNPSPSEKLYVLAEDKLREAALESALRQNAETNTRDMLEAFLRSLGFESVTVAFDPPPAQP